MNRDLEKIYNHKIVEEKIYKNWLDKKYFKSFIDNTKKPYTIIMPPPNITGYLHMGHALNITIQDILIRFKKMQGYNTLLLPGTDHASISTEIKIVQELNKKGLTKEDIGKEEFLKHAWQWKEKYGSKIIDQLKKLGASCDWDREKFTLDESICDAVKEFFINLYEKNYIYKDKKLINWCCKCKTTISDAEVEHIENNSYLWYFKYPIKDTKEFLEFATTRPETILGDTAIAVNPKDKRYKKYIGKKVIVPIVNREIPIIEDNYVEMEFGTGVVKITPAHDFNDFLVYKRHNIDFINIMNDDGTINKNGMEYEGLDKYEVRKKIIDKFKNLKLFIKKEEIKNTIGIHDRCSTVIEPIMKEQWFIKMKEISKKAIEELKNNNLNFVPKRFEKIYLNWIENIHDWCISRQLWWGHKIPVYYCENCNEIHVSKKQPKICKKCSSNKLIQDENTLDTWFSSSLWPFATLGWPKKNEELDYFYPTNVLVTAYDIIFFWIVRMVISGLEQTKKVPFKDVLIHGLIKDSKGMKMSKSLGNGIDPLEIIDNYGADSLRLTLIIGTSPGNDQRFYLEKVEFNRNFLNKIWNASRFILMNFEEIDYNISLNNLKNEDKWILSKINKLIKEVTENIENYELGIAISKIQNFIWEEYCDWYIEIIKPRLYNKEDNTRKEALWTLKKVFIDLLKLMHPYIPFITEEIFTYIQSKEKSILYSKWPKYNEKYNFEKEEENIEIMKKTIKTIRNIRSEMNTHPSKKVQAIIVSEDSNIIKIFKDSILFFKSLGHINEVIIKDKEINNKDFISVVIPKGVIYIPFNELVHKEKEKERLKKEKEKLEFEVNRIEKKLSNEGFIKNAPQKLILEEKCKLNKYKEMLYQVKTQLEKL